MTASVWQIYVLECSNGSLYTGISTDSARRFLQHQSGKGARYTRSHPPRKMLASLTLGTRSAAQSAEHAIKQLRAPAKRALCRRIAAGAVNGASELEAALRALRGA